MHDQIAPAADIVPANTIPNTIFLRVGLPLAPYYFKTVVVPAQTPSQLLSSLAGILSLFGVFGLLKSTGHQSSKICRQRRKPRKTAGTRNSGDYPEAIIPAHAFINEDSEPSDVF